MASGDIVTIRCGNCKEPAVGPADAKPSDRITCKKCGRTDTYGTVLSEAKAHATETMAVHMRTRMEKALSSARFIKVEGPRPRVGRHRWTCDIEL